MTIFKIFHFFFSVLTTIKNNFLRISKKFNYVEKWVLKTISWYAWNLLMWYIFLSLSLWGFDEEYSFIDLRSILLLVSAWILTPLFLFIFSFLWLFNSNSNDLQIPFQISALKTIKRETLDRKRHLLSISRIEEEEGFAVIFPWLQFDGIQARPHQSQCCRSGIWIFNWEVFVVGLDMSAL